MVKAKIVVVCGDPGGASALEPVVRSLTQLPGVSVKIHATDYASAFLKGRGICADTRIDDPSTDSAIRDLRHEQTQLLFTGTSWGNRPEKPYWVAAKRLKIPSIALLDYWSDYRRRFQDPSGELENLPDMICVMDQIAKAEMLAVGFPESLITITGAPHLERLSEVRASLFQENREALRQRLNWDSEEGLTVLFFSEPISQSDGLALGYNEYSVAEEILKTLERISQQFLKKIRLVIKTHPKEAKDKFDFLQSSYVKVKSVAEGSSYQWAAACDLVIGMKTILLMELCYLGIYSLSYQPNLRHADTLVSNRFGWTVPIYDTRTFSVMLEKHLLNLGSICSHLQNIKNIPIPSGATQSIVDLILTSLRSFET